VYPAGSGNKYELECILYPVGSGYSMVL